MRVDATCHFCGPIELEVAAEPTEMTLKESGALAAMAAHVESPEHEAQLHLQMPHG